MSAFDDILTNSVGPALRSVHGEALTFTEPDGSSHSLTGVWAAGPSSAPVDADGQVRLERATCIVWAADWAAPARLSTVSRGGRTWTAERVGPIAGGAFSLELIASEPLERGDPAAVRRR